MTKRFGCMILAVVVSGLVSACSEDEPERVGKVYDPEIEQMRTCIYRDGILTRALEEYRFAIGSYPTSKQGLKALLERPKGLANPKLWAGPYLDDETCLSDTWGNQYEYKFPGQTHDNSYDIKSAGKDGQMGTDDDVLNWDVR